MDCQIQSDYNMVSKLALRVALQTMKERCLSLQQRLSSIEDENQTLRGRLESDTQYHESYQNQNNKGLTHNNAELENLRSQVAELSRQKVQLSDHINMVANENRKLWSRLSQIAKEQDLIKNQSKKIKASISHFAEEELDSPRMASQNLIRSRTFTQHSPNPNLRLKVINFEAGEKNIDDPSLEEVLLVDGSDDDESSNRELKSDEMMGVCETELGFAYLNVQASVDDDFNIEAKKCLEGLHKIRVEALQQHLDITSAISALENRFVLQGCAECAKNSRKPEMVDKSLGTDESVPDIYSSMPHAAELKESCSSVGQTPGHLDVIRLKIEADENDKVCPMCGTTFNSLITFNEFRGHVESHFIDDSLTDSNIEQNFEFVSQTVGNF